MAFKKGNKFAPGGRRAGAGRKKGVPNKVTPTIRQAYTAFVEANIPMFQRLLNRVAKDSPAEALNIIARYSEFCLPKLMRAEVTGEDGATLLPPIIAISFVNGGPGQGGKLIEHEEDEQPAALVLSQPAAQPQAS